MTSPDHSGASVNSQRSPLAGVRVLLFALYLPGPVAAARLAALGATVVKVEPLAGDPFEALASPWYDHLCSEVDVRRLDVKDPHSREALHELLFNSDVFLTAFRPASLKRLELDAETLRERYPRLCQVGIVGQAGDSSNVAGHDLTYQAHSGLIQAPHMPATLLADLAGAERAVSAVLALLFARSNGANNLYAEVSLADAVADFAAPLRFALTTRDGPLGGADPFYRLYETRDGFVALAALEPHFRVRTSSVLNINVPPELLLANASIEQLSRASNVFAQLRATFLERKSAEWEAWGREHDLPVAAVHGPLSPS